jgi:hypothetical protein
MNAHRIDSPVSNLAIAYEADSKFFRDFANRKMLIRLAFMGEFDIDMPPGEHLQIPQLWTLVTAVSSGIHSVVPLYRGRKFWSFIKDDAAIGMVLIDIARREGIDAEEFRAFERKVIAKNKQVLSSGTRTIH